MEAPSRPQVGPSAGPVGVRMGGAMPWHRRGKLAAPHGTHGLHGKFFPAVVAGGFADEGYLMTTIFEIFQKNAE